MEDELFKAIIHNALMDLFFNVRDKEKIDKEETYAWFNYDDRPYEDGYITFIDACDLAGYDYKQWRYVAYLIYSGKLSREDYLDLMSVEEVVREPKHSVMLNYPELPFNPLVYAVRSFNTLEEANLYNATL
jgi:hypothetical protein